MKTTVEDPVCKRMIDVADAAGQLDHDGWAYFFCSLDCRNKFVCQPSKYASQPPLLGPGPPHGGGAKQPLSNFNK